MALETIRPETDEQVRDAIAWAADGGGTLELVGAGTKRKWGRPVDVAARLDLSGLSGIKMYEPEELVMTARAGTRLAEIEAAMSQHGQRLAFEPPDFGSLFGAADENQTLGGLIGANLSGPRRIQAGAARDHLLGFTAVSGRAETFKSGGRVVKNVTGFDLSKLMAGSFGTLAAMTSLTFKVLPVPEDVRTVAIVGASEEAALAALSRALQSPHDVTGATHLPATAASRLPVLAKFGASVTLVRIEGPGPSVIPRIAALRDLIAAVGETAELDAAESEAVWHEVRDVAIFAPSRDHQIWRLSVPPMSGVRAAASVLEAATGHAIYDWGGGLVWLFLSPADDAHQQAIRAAVDEAGGHATLIRASTEVRARAEIFEPLIGEAGALTRRIKENFDPKGVLNPGRMYAGV